MEKTKHYVKVPNIIRTILELKSKLMELEQRIEKLEKHK